MDKFVLFCKWTIISVCILVQLYYDRITWPL